MNKKILPQIRKKLRPLLKPTNDTDAFIGSESAHDLFEDQGWNACIKRALSSGTIPKTKKKDSKKPVEYAQAEGWNRAIKKIRRLDYENNKKKIK